MKTNNNNNCRFFYAFHPVLYVSTSIYIETKRQLPRLQARLRVKSISGMKIEVPSLLCWLILIQSHTTLVQGLIVSGELNANSHYVTSFCCQRKLVHGQAHVEAEIHIPHGASYITFFYHSDWDTNVAEAIQDGEQEKQAFRE